MIQKVTKKCWPMVLDTPILSHYHKKSRIRISFALFRKHVLHFTLSLNYENKTKEKGSQMEMQLKHSKFRLWKQNKYTSVHYHVPCSQIIQWLGARYRTNSLAASALQSSASIEHHHHQTRTSKINNTKCKNPCWFVRLPKKIILNFGAGKAILNLNYYGNYDGKGPKKCQKIKHTISDFLSCRFLGNLLGLGNNLFNSSNHVKRLLRKVIVFTV